MKQLGGSLVVARVGITLNSFTMSTGVECVVAASGRGSTALAMGGVWVCLKNGASSDLRTNSELHERWGRSYVEACNHQGNSYK